ncbi:MAG: hypothetical protein OEZ05_09285 [Nitrospirota bacterium]|nr:hypothetical protein [Nitrospirota bacterium]MDH5586806.1 hypothetical protein [Nitrospirota bacterium]
MSPSSVINKVLAIVLLSLTTTPIFAEATTSLKSYYSPIVRLEADKGYFLITTNSGIQWVQVEDAAKEHLKTLEVGDMIDVVVELRPDPVPPLLKSWKLARSASPCTVFNGHTCSKE